MKELMRLLGSGPLRHRIHSTEGAMVDSERSKGVRKTPGGHRLQRCHQKTLVASAPGAASPTTPSIPSEPGTSTSSVGLALKMADLVITNEESHLQSKKHRLSQGNHESE